jgi:hypothetical protein
MTLVVRKHEYTERRNRRIRIEFPAALAIHSRRMGFAPRRPQIDATVRHASMAGLEILSETAIPEGARLQLWVCVDNDETVRLQGKVMWSKANGEEGSYLAGVLLDARPKAGMAYWEDLIAEHIRRRDA